MSRASLAVEVAAMPAYGGPAKLVTVYTQPCGDASPRTVMVEVLEPTQRTVSVRVGHSRAAKVESDSTATGDADDDPAKKMKAPRRQPSGPQEQVAQQKQNGRNHSAKSCAIEAQHDRILDALRRRPHTTHDLRCLVGVFQVSTRVKELRELGWNIETHRVNIVDTYGFLHPRCALYSLEEAAQ